MKNTKQRKLTVSIGTAAYNENQSIGEMLMSVFTQEEKNIAIKEIIVISDGSTDDTVDKVKKIQDKRIKIINDDKRVGQPERIRQLLHIFKGDILVLIDSDMIMENKDTLKKFVLGFLKDKKIGLISPNVMPLPARTFIETAINNYLYARASLFNEYNIEISAYFAHGCLAFSRKFAKSLRIPPDILNTDAFSYFSCISKGYKFLFAKDAIIYYRSPQNIEDHIKQSTRHLTGGIQLYKYFGRETVDEGFKLPKMALIRIMLYQLLRNPIGYVFLKVLNTYCYYKSKKIANKADVKWEVISTSKNLAGKY